MIDNEIVLYDSIRPVRWQADGLYLLDQRKLPDEEVYLHIVSTQALYQAIKEMVVRGAPAIGIAAAYGAVIAATESKQAGRQDFQARLDLLASSRPTAVNLFNALKAAQRIAVDSADPISSLLSWAHRWLADDISANKAIGAYGARCFAAGSRVLTHCNAGALATGGYGTALGVIRKAYQNGQLTHIYSAETRPWNQGSRLSLWEFEQENIPATLIADSAAASLMQKGLIDWVVVGADSICRNGDIANKIGTYSLAVLAKHHGVKLMVAAPTTTIDLSAESGDSIVIEQRAVSEILPANYVDGVVNALNPVFDVTPAHLISAIVTEKGVIESPDARKMRVLTE
ncbi:S-methyl-5-thioribose-1-phosphate isomerase [Cycloclasticus sp. 46_120_T64]|nr:S-methyl-5-thioribose-1-phosphate isomerase [Cycloclasticus sp. 46_120_T64]